MWGLDAKAPGLNGPALKPVFSGLQSERFAPPPSHVLSCNRKRPYFIYQDSISPQAQMKFCYSD